MVEVGVGVANGLLATELRTEFDMST
jgi:hypothetical protein